MDAREYKRVLYRRLPYFLIQSIYSFFPPLDSLAATHETNTIASNTSVVQENQASKLLTTRHFYAYYPHDKVVFYAAPDIHLHLLDNPSILCHLIRLLRPSDLKSHVYIGFALFDNQVLDQIRQKDNGKVLDILFENTDMVITMTPFFSS